MTDIHTAPYWRNTYPYEPGSKVSSGPSVEAAEMMRPVAKTLRERVFAEIKTASTPPTADEIAIRMGRSPFSIRPRVAELSAAGRILTAQGRGTNTSGATAGRWQIAQLAAGEVGA